MENQNWSGHAEFVALFMTLLGGYYMIHQDIEAHTARIDQVNTRIDQQIEMQTARIDQVNARSDQLYEMFIDLLKEGRK